MWQLSNQKFRGPKGFGKRKPGMGPGGSVQLALDFRGVKIWGMSLPVISLTVILVGGSLCPQSTFGAEDRVCNIRTKDVMQQQVL